VEKAVMLTGESLGTLPLDLSPNGEVDFGLGILELGILELGGTSSVAVALGAGGSGPGGTLEWRRPQRGRSLAGRRLSRQRAG
jgi:hypothetical protein